MSSLELGQVSEVCKCIVKDLSSSNFIMKQQATSKTRVEEERGGEEERRGEEWRLTKVIRGQGRGRQKSRGERHLLI